MTPERTCIVTREKLSKNELLRIVRIKNPDGSFSVEIDQTGKKSGRGVYVKKDPEILKIAINKGKIVWGLQLGRKLNEKERQKLQF